MTESINNAGLAELYRRACAQRDAEWLDGDTLAALAEGQLDVGQRERVAQALAGSPAQADLVRLLAELAPASQQLADGVVERARAPRRGHLRVVASVPRQQIAAASARPARHRAPVLRWAAAAALVAAVVGGVGWEALHTGPQTAMTATITPPVPAPADTIFSAGMNGELAGTANSADQIFRSSFRHQKRG